jgi:hypothetical protein
MGWFGHPIFLHGGGRHPSPTMGGGRNHPHGPRGLPATPGAKKKKKGLA